MNDYRNTIRRNASRLQELKARIDETFRAKPHGEAHHAACAVFHGEYDGLAFPGGLGGGLPKLKGGNVETVEAAIQFLEVGPRFHRSGYIAEDILRHLKHVELTRRQRERLLPIILASLEGGGRRQFHSCAKLAGRIQDKRIEAKARELLTSVNAETKRRAGVVIDIMRSGKPQKEPAGKSTARLRRAREPEAPRKEKCHGK